LIIDNSDKFNKKQKLDTGIWMKNIKFSIVLFMLVSLTITFTSSLSAENNEKEMIAFNFVEVNIPTIIKFISDITGNNFLFDERIKGKVTIIAPTKLSIDESFTLFTSVLSLKGYTIIPSGPKTYKIIPSSLAKQAGMITVDEAIPVNEGYITKLIPVTHIQAEETLQFLRPVVSRDGHISAFGPRNLLLVVDSAVNIEKIVSILKLIDKPSVLEEKAKINVYFLEHADATNLAKVLQGIMKDLQTSYKSTSRSKQKSVAKAAPVLSLTPDKATNSIVIVAPPSDYQNIAQVIETLDKKRKQVFVEAMIVEATIEKLQDLGSKWRIIAESEGEPVTVGGFGNIGSDTVLDIVNGLTGFSVGGMGNFMDINVTSVSDSGTVTSSTLTSPGFAALFSMDEFKDVINVLSTPQILTSDNEEAEILVGENVPFISQRESDTASTTVLNSIQRTDVGIKLKITPQITEGDYVKLNIFQEISAVKKASDEILTTVGPTTTKRSTKTSVVVKDGKTVVIGGLMKEEEEEIIHKIPLLGDIPLLGWLFKFRNTIKTKTNLLVFLSPHIIKETPQLAKITKKKHKEFVKSEKFYYQDELLVKFREDVSEDRALEIITEKEATVIKHFKKINIYHIKLESGQEMEDAIEEFTSMPEVLYSEPNYRFKIQNKTSERGQDNNTKQPLPSDDIDKTGTIQEEKSDPSEDMDKKRIAPADADETSDADIQGATESQQIQAVNNTKTEEITDKNIKNEEAVSSETVQTGPYSAGDRKYFIQVGAWKNVKYAQEALEKLRTRYPDTYLVEEDNFNKVRIPGTMTKKDNILILEELREKFDLKPVLVRTSK
jgi:general secretion pathway protein D